MGLSLSPKVLVLKTITESNTDSSVHILRFDSNLPSHPGILGMKFSKPIFSPSENGDNHSTNLIGFL